MKYSKDELRRHVRVERMELTQEKLELTKLIRRHADRVGAIEARLDELDQAETLLEHE